MRSTSEKRFEDTDWQTTILMALSASCAPPAANKQTLRNCWLNWCASSNLRDLRRNVCGRLRGLCRSPPEPTRSRCSTRNDVAAPVSRGAVGQAGETGSSTSSRSEPPNPTIHIRTIRTKPIWRRDDVPGPGNLRLRRSFWSAWRWSARSSGSNEFEPGPPNASPLMEITQGPTTMQPRSNLTVATSSEAGATLKDIPRPAEGKVASPEEQPIDLTARVSPNNPPQSDFARTVIGASQPDASDGKPVAASVNTSAVAAPIVAPQPVASQSLDPKPAPTVSLPPELDADRDANPLHHRLGRGGAFNECAIAARNECAIAARQARTEACDRGDWCRASVDVQTRFAHQAFKQV